ncbi:MAG: hypothetical protein ABSG70_07205 [Terriglobales bacterium]|jgi:hypothetical protein
MHIRGAQLNPALQFDAVCAAQRAEAKREAAATRRKLTEAASKLRGGGVENIWDVWARQENSEDHPSKKKNQQTFGELLASFLMR